ncbi:putative reverse transcriptase domain-containing protein [Tanacetum coccineum]
MALLSMRARKFYQRTGRKIIINGSNTAGYDKSKVECFNCHKMGHFTRECRAPRSKDQRNRNQGSSSKAVRIEDASEKAMCAIDGAGFNWSDMAEEEIQMKSAEKIEEEDVATQKEMKEVFKESGAKRKKSIPIKSTRKRQKMEEDAEKEELKGFLDIIPREEVPIEVESLSAKFPIVDWKTCVLTENFMYYQIFRGDGSSKNYKILSKMLEDFDRQDVEELYRLVKERYSTSRPEGYDLMLWGDLHTLFEPDEEDELWKNQHEYNVISWSLYDFCGIHILLMQNGIAIHMLTEKKYPLSQEMISKMLKKKLEVDHESS